MTESNIPVFRAQLRYETLDDFIEGYSRFILPGKMFIPLDASQLKPVDSRVRFDFRLSDGLRALVGEGIVDEVRGTDTDGGPTGLVVRYTHLSRRSKQLVGQIVDLKRAEARSKRETVSTSASETTSPEHARPPEADAPAGGHAEATSPVIDTEDEPPEDPSPTAEESAEQAMPSEPGDEDVGLGGADTAPGEDSEAARAGSEPEPTSAEEEAPLEDQLFGDVSSNDERDPDETSEDEAPLEPETAESPPPGLEESPDSEPDVDDTAESLDFDLDGEFGDPPGTDDAGGGSSADAEPEDDGFTGFEEVEESETEAAGDGPTQLGETEAGVQILAFDEEMSEEEAEEFAEFTEGDEEEDVDELFDGVFQSGGEASEDPFSDEGDLFGGEDSGDEEELFGGGDAAETDDALFASGAETGDDPPEREEDGEAAGEDDGAAPKAPEPEETPFEDSETTAKQEAPADIEESEGTIGSEISSAIEEELDEEEEEEPEGAETLDADSFTKEQEEDDDETSEPIAEEPLPEPPLPDEEEPAGPTEDEPEAMELDLEDSNVESHGFDRDTATSEVDPLDEVDSESLTQTGPRGEDAVAADEPSAVDPIEAGEAPEEGDRDDASSDSRKPARDASESSESSGSFVGASNDDEDLDRALDSLAEPDDGDKELSLSIGAESSVEDTSPPDVPDETDENEEDSLEALVADAQKDIEQRQKASQEEDEDGDVLDEVLGEELPPPPEDDFEFELASEGPEREESEDGPAVFGEEQPSDQSGSEQGTGAGDETSDAESSDEDAEAEKGGGGFFSNFFGGND